MEMILIIGKGIALIGSFILIGFILGGGNGGYP